MRSSSVATSTACTSRAADARRNTCSIIGRPAMLARIFPGRRVEWNLAGMTARTDDSVSVNGRRSTELGCTTNHTTVKLLRWLSRAIEHEHADRASDSSSSPRSRRGCWVVATTQDVGRTRSRRSLRAQPAGVRASTVQFTHQLRERLKRRSRRNAAAIRSCTARAILRRRCAPRGAGRGRSRGAAARAAGPDLQVVRHRRQPAGRRQGADRDRDR